MSRVRRVLRAEGYIVELVQNGAAVVERIEREPRIEIVLLDGLEDLDRARALAAAREHDVWCIYLESRGTSRRMLGDERAEFVAAVPLDADDAQIARTLRAVIAARRARAVHG